jgi:hypothetical protein
MHAVCTVYYINSYNLLLNRHFCTVEVLFFYLLSIYIYFVYTVYAAEELIARRVLLYIMSTCDCI